jgi:glucose dehydrogenase
LNVVAALDVWTGDILWRQFLPDNEEIDLIRISGAGAGKMVVSVSGGGKYVRVFSMITGDLFWDDLTRPAGKVVQPIHQPAVQGFRFWKYSPSALSPQPGHF